MSEMKLDPTEEVANEKLASRLPKPATYHILCSLIKPKDTFESGIVKADKTRYYEEILTPAMFVVALGPDAYRDAKRFPSGPSCKEGDFVIVRPHSGTRLKIDGQEFRLINDDSIEAVIEDPRGLESA